MKVLNLLQSGKYSGAENVVFQIISMLKNDDIDFIYSSRDGQIREALDERKIKYNLMSDFSLSEIRRVISEEKPDIIHAHDMRASFYASLCCGNIPLICHVHNNNFDSRGFSLKSLLFYYAARKAKHIFWVSQSCFDGYKFHKSLEKKSTVLYNIIDIEALQTKAQLDKKKYDYDIVYLGRLTYPKNPQRLLKVLKDVLNKRPETKIAIIGTGDMADEINDVIINENLYNIDYLGFNNNPYKMLNDCKLMIMTSRWEGTPMCALEALSLGIPIVSTPTDGLKDLISNGINGYTCENDDDLVDRICLILNDRNLQKELSRNASTNVQKLMDVQCYKSSIKRQYKY